MKKQEKKVFAFSREHFFRISARNTKNLIVGKFCIDPELFLMQFSDELVFFSEGFITIIIFSKWKGIKRDGRGGLN